MSVRAKRYRIARFWLIAVVVLLTPVVLLTSGPAVAQDADAPAAAVGAPATDPLAVPEGPPAEQAKFITQTLSRPPRNAEERQKAIQAMLEAADKILAGKPSEAEAGVAVQVKLMFVQEEGALGKLADELSKANLTQAARLVRGGLLTIRVSGAAMQSPEQFKKAVEEVNQHLEKDPIQVADFQLVTQVADMAERTDQAELAVDVLNTFSKQCAASKDVQVAGLAKRVEPMLRRVSLVGNPMEVEGTILGGDKFDLSKHQGKVVLIDFWATWCGPCVAEVPNMKATYAKYHDRGFDIVGISLDRDRQSLETFIKDREIPWTILFDEGGRSATANYYGIAAIPTMVLIGRDGNVASLNARGPQLPAKLEKLLGQPAVVARADPEPADAPPEDEPKQKAPKKEAPKKNEPLKKPVVIKITAKGVASIDEKLFEGGSFLALMAAKVPEADRAATPIRIEASSDVKRQNATRGIDALKKLGFRVFNYVKQPTGSKLH